VPVTVAEPFVTLTVPTLYQVIGGCPFCHRRHAFAGL